VHNDIFRVLCGYYSSVWMVVWSWNVCRGREHKCDLMYGTKSALWILCIYFHLCTCTCLIFGSGVHTRRDVTSSCKNFFAAYGFLCSSLICYSFALLHFFVDIIQLKNNVHSVYQIGRPENHSRLTVKKLPRCCLRFSVSESALCDQPFLLSHPWVMNVGHGPRIVNSGCDQEIWVYI
jgi:hypothetical protein